MIGSGMPISQSRPPFIMAGTSRSSSAGQRAPGPRRFHGQAWTRPSFAPRRCRLRRGTLHPAHDGRRRTAEHAQDRARAAQPDRRRRRRQRAPRCARRAPRRPRLGADLVMFPELFLAGYPPEDLVLKPAFQDACREACEALARETARRRPGGARRPALGRERRASTTPMRCSTPARSRRCASRSTCRTTASSTRSASSRRARCPGRW